MNNKPLIVLLAGGEGRRIGGDKPQRRLGGQTLLERALTLTKNYGGTLALSVRQGADPMVGPVPVIFDPPDIEGPLAGLMAGFNEAVRCGTSRVMLVPTDMPFLPTDLDLGLGEALDSHPHSGVAVAYGGGREHPVCSMWRVGVASALISYVDEGRRSLKGLADRVGKAVVNWPGDPFFNINDTEALAEAERRLLG